MCETGAATPGGEYAARYERAVLALRAICRPEHFDGALAETRKRQQERGLGAVGAVDSVYDDVALGWVPDAVPPHPHSRSSVTRCARPTTPDPATHPAHAQETLR